LGIGANSFDVTVRAQDYYSFAGMTLLGTGLSFLFPLVLMGLGRVGILQASTLSSNRRGALVAIAIIAALLPTGDPVSLIIEIVPLVALYELSILMLKWQERTARTQ
jgi:sec-independent protein translocase protein TatC